MEEQSIDWAVYAHAQAALAKSYVVNDRGEGLEYALNKALVQNHTMSDVERWIRTGARRDRYRAQLTRLNTVSWQPATLDPSVVLEARSEISYVESHVKGFSLLRKVADGYGYDELAIVYKADTSALRKRVSRIRDRAQEILTSPELGIVAH